MADEQEMFAVIKASEAENEVIYGIFGRKSGDFFQNTSKIQSINDNLCRLARANQRARQDPVERNT